MQTSRYVQANTNGRLHDAREPSLSPLNRSFLYGDAIYEVWRTYHGAVFAWLEHWARLERSARALHLALPWTAEQFWPEVQRTTAAFRAATGYGGDLYIRLQFTRGAGAIGLDTALADQPLFVLLVQPVPQLSEEAQRNGLRLSIATGLRRNPAFALNPAWKTGNYLNNLLALREARARGADEVVMLNLAGDLTEAAVCNLAFVRGGEIHTPSLDSGILEGITRGLVGREVAAGAGLRWVERRIPADEISAFDECFLLATTKDVQPVRQIDAVAYRVGPGTATARLKQAFADYARAYAEAHPERRA